MFPIYCEHFGLIRAPFNVTPDPSFLYLSASHKEALAQLVYGIKARRGFVVLTGEVGTGKTTLIRCLLDELNGAKTALVFNMIVTPKDLLFNVCEKFGLISYEENHREIRDYLAVLDRFLLESYRNEENVALIIDEAQNLPAEVLECVRLLSNFETSQDKLLQIVLVGQPELAIRLNASELRQLKQRVALRHHLRPLNSADCKEYIAKRLEIAGGSISLFDADALEAVHAFSAGIPRLINILCDNGLLTAYALRKRTVGAGIIEEIARDLQLAVLPRNRLAQRETVVTNPKDRLLWTPKEGNFQFSDLLNVARTGSSKIEQSFAKVGPSSKPAMGEGSKSRDRAPDHPKERGREASTEAESGSDTVPVAFFGHMTFVLTEAMGPMASLVIRDQVSALGEALEAFPKSRLVELVELASQEILDESVKIHFQRAMFEEIRTIHPAQEQK